MGALYHATIIVGGAPYSGMVQRGNLATGESMDDLIIQGGLVAGQQQDIAIQHGRIRQIAPGLHVEARERLDVTGKLVLPGFVESHIHPDKAFVADRAPGLTSGGPTPQVLLAELKKAFTVEDIYQRARRALRYAVRHG